MAMNPDPKQVLTELTVLAAQAGSEAAFRDLHGLWRADLRRLALVRVERDEAADEVMTEVWLAIVRGLARLDDPACFPRWAFRIVDRRCTDWIRRRATARRHAVAVAAEAEHFAPAAVPAIAAHEPADEVVALRAAVTRLPADARKLLHLYYELGRSVAEIAEILDLPSGTVKSRLFSVRETLKAQLERKLP
ncbi:MAG: sigma-70 family RNA polymerase sigma factor [Candidatus Didemnitutus sp.]|nr:sigma-70 family RNA polymerase sigma factor [Candidatus Didemnitutus sp.]